VEHRPVAFDASAIKAALSGLPLGGLRVLQRTGSTNDEALAWASAGAAHLSLVAANEQTAGRGRGGREWLTPPGTALAFSLILRGVGDAPSPGRLAGLGAMAAANACETLGLHPEIKWPNDVLLNGRKVAGVLVESRWSGDEREASIIGVGMNVLAGSAPPDGEVLHPATSLEDGLGTKPDRVQVLGLTLEAMLRWLPELQGAAFLRAWEDRLAFRGRAVQLVQDGMQDITGTLEGLEDDGSLRLRGEQGVIKVRMGEIHLYPAGDRMG
jgi:BirA family biotin operon repressor/biotin-[acetyl-CoA-carboxylase] ligase